MNDFTNIHEKYLKHFERRHEEALMSQVPKLREGQLLDVLPSGKAVSVDNVTKIVSRKLDIPKEEVSNTIQRLIDNGKVATSTGFKSRTKYIRKSL